MKKLFIITLILTIIISINNVNGALTDGIISYYNYSTNTSSIAIDVLNYQNGSIASKVELVSGKIGNALYFPSRTGTDVQVDYGSPPKFDFQNNAQFTFNMWLKPNDNGTSTRAILNKDDGTGSTAPFLFAFNGWSPSGAIFSYNNVDWFNIGDGAKFRVDVGNWHMATFIYNGSDLITYVDGVLNKSTPYTYVGNANYNLKMNPPNGASDTWQFITAVDEFGIWNRSLNSSEVSQLYNTGTGLTYPFTTETPTILPSYNVTNIQTPSDINSTTLFINITTNINNLTNNSNMSNGYTIINYSIHTNLNNDCSVFYQDTCHEQHSSNIRNMTKITNNSFYTIIDDTELIPAYYPYNYDFINSNLGNNYTAYNNNNIKFNIFNFSNTTNNTYLAVEMDAVNISSSTASMLIYYCNSSYVTGNPLTDVNCELIQTYLPQSWSHTHNFSRHGGFTFQINSVKKTQNSSIIFVSPNLLQANGWRFRYVLNTSYDNRSFRNGNFNSWTTTPYIYDIHLHQYDQANDYFTYYTKYYDNNDNTNVSSTVIDWYNVTQYPPTTSTILQPTCESTDYTYGGSEIINFSWSQSSDVNNDAILYNLYLYNPLMVQQLIYNGSNKNTTLNVSILSSDYYYTQIVSCDGFACSYGDINCVFNICTNDWTQTIQPCVNSVQLITYTDSNNCPSQYGVPVTNGTYGACTVAPTEIKTVYNDDMLVLIILGFFLVLAIVLAITVHEAFFGLSALIVALMFTTFLYYDYPDILNYFAVFMIILLSGMWILISRKR